MAETKDSNEAEPSETRWAELDLRSLALFRVLLGLFVLATLAQSAPHWGEFFTDSGVLPRETLISSEYSDTWLSFHLGTGYLYTQVGLNLTLAALAVGLIVGWRTPWMVLGCWVLLGSLTARNPFIFDRGNLQLALCLFWGFFLPLGAKWSLDARAGRRCFGQSQGIAAAALVIQFAQIYLFTAYLKNGPFWLNRGDGLEHSLISPLFATPLSLWLSEAAVPWLSFLNYTVIAGELLVALLLLCPWSVPITRGFAIVLLLGFHLSVACLFTLGLFPWLGAALPLVFLPREFWEGAGKRWSDFCDRHFGPIVAVTPPLPSKRLTVAWRLGLASCISLTVLSNFSFTTGYPQWARTGFVRELSGALRLSQHWELFSPIPPYYGHFTLTVTPPEGEPITVFEGPPTREQPKLADFPSHGWKMLMIASLFPSFEVVRPGIVKSLAQRSGITSLEGYSVSYKFQARLADSEGKLKAPEDWKLWEK